MSRLQYCLVFSFLGYQLAFCQTNGTINLPSSLCESGTVVQSAAVSTPTLNQWCEGPVVAPNGTLYFAEQNSGNLWKVTPAGVMTKLVNIGSYSNGLEFSPVSGKLVACEKSQITERDTATGAVLKVLTTDNARDWTAGGSGGSNDLTFAMNGDMFFTSWNQHIYFLSRDGTVKKDWNFPSSYGTCHWNGIEYIEEKGFIYVCQYGKNRVVTFKVNPQTHLIDTSTMAQFGPTLNNADGITVDEHYNVYVCCNSNQGAYPNSVVVMDSTGKVLGSIKMNQGNTFAAVNCVFGTSMSGGGPNPTTLYVTGVKGAFKIQLKVRGRVWPNVTATEKFNKKSYFNATPTSFLQNAVIINGFNTASPLTMGVFDLRGSKIPKSALAHPGMSNMTAVVRTTAGETMHFTMIR